MRTIRSPRLSWSTSAVALASACWLVFALRGDAEVVAPGGPLLATNGAGLARPWQRSLELSPNLQVNLATGNLNVRFVTSRFRHRGLSPHQELVLYHNSLAATKPGDYTGGLGLGGGWSSSVGSRLETVSANVKRLTRSDGGEVHFEQQTNGSWKTLGGARLALANGGGQWTVTSFEQWQAVYDAAGKLRVVRDPSGNENSVTWDGARVERATEPSGRYSEFLYDASGVLDRVHSSGVPGSWPFLEDGNGRLFQVDDPFGGNVTFTYDSAGRVQSFTDHGGNTWQFTYWTSGNKAGRVRVVTRPDGETLSFDYVFAVNVVRAELTDVRGNLWKVKHDRNETPALKSIESPVGNSWFYQHDNQRRLEEVVSPLGHTWRYTYDSASNLSTETDPDEIVTTYTYDALHNFTSRTVDGDTTSFFYEDLEHPTRVTRVVQAPDDAGQTATTTLEYFGPSDGTPAGVWNGLLARLVDPRGCEMRFGYDEHGTPNGVQEGPPSATGSVDYRFNQPGFEFVDWGGMTYPPGFPALPALPPQIQGRLSYNGATTSSWWGERASDSRALEVPIDTGSGFEYSSVSHSYDFDALGRVEGFEFFTDEPLLGDAQRSFSQVFDDDAPEAPVVCTGPDGDELEIRTGAEGAVTRQESNGGGAGELALDVDYTHDGEVRTVTRGDGTSSHYTYLPSGRLDTLEHRLGATQLLFQDYAYDARGIPSGVTETSPAGTVVKTWVHDSRGRLTSETRASGGVAQEERYTYDSAGNRKQHATYVNGALSGTNTYLYDSQAPAVFSSSNNRLMGVERTSAGGTLLSQVFFFYENPFGNVSRIVRRAAGSTHCDSTVLLYAEDASPWLAWDESWDDFGSGPVNVVRGNILETRQTHGSARLWRWRSGSSLAPLPGVEWIADAGNTRSIFRIAAGGGMTPLELELDGAQRLTASGASYDLCDLVGSTRLTSAGGDVTSQDYTAFGVRLSSGGSVPTFGFAGAFGVRQGFGGQPLTSSKLVAMGHRWYSPEFGRFLMRDPIGASGGFNVYAFASSQPTYVVDPDGLAPQKDDPNLREEHRKCMDGFPPRVEPPFERPPGPKLELFPPEWFAPRPGDPDFIGPLPFVGPPAPPEHENEGFIGPPLPPDFEPPV